MSQTDFVSRGQALVARGQYQEAVKVCRLGLLAKPTAVDGRIVLGQALLALKRYDEVLGEMRVAIELDRGQMAAHALKAEALLAKGDLHAAIEALHAARAIAPGDPRVLRLLGEAERGGRAAGAAHPSSAFLIGNDTKHYPAAEEADPVPDPADEPSSGFTKTRVVTGKRPAPGAGELTPSPAVLAVGDRSGTVEVDPARDALGEDELELDEPAAPPSRGNRAAKAAPDEENSFLDREETGDIARVEAKRAVRESIQLPSGPLGTPGSSPRAPLPPPVRKATIEGTSAPSRPRGPSFVPLALQPTVPASSMPPPPVPLPPPPPAPIIPLAASMPTLAAMPTPQPPAPQPPAPDDIANAPTNIALAMPPEMRWAAAQEPTMRPSALDMRDRDRGGGAASAHLELSTVPARARKRSPLAIAAWIVAGAAVIGGGVLAGFEIRAVRLDKQIAAARRRAAELAKSDTFAGWTAAAASLGGIVQAAPTPENRAALARAKAVIAYEFAAGAADAKAAIDGLAGSGGYDAQIAAAYLALAQGDAKAAKQAADAVLAAAPADPAASYVAGQAALLAGDVTTAIQLAKRAESGEARPQFALGAARAEAAGFAWDDALAAIDRALAASPDDPAAVIARGDVLADSGRLRTVDVRAALLRVAQDARSGGANAASPAQGAFADLSLARVDMARGDAATARADVNAAAGLGIDDQRFAEAAVETLLAIGEIKIGEKAAHTAITSFPGSRRARIALARILLAQNDPAGAAAALAGGPALGPLGTALQGRAQLAAGDVDGARADFDAALAQQSGLEPALVGQAWLALRQDDVATAHRLIDPRVSDKGESPDVTIVYAAVLRRGDDAAKAKARALLEHVVAGGGGGELATAELELARVDRDLGEFGEARKHYANAGQLGSAEARLEGAVMAIDDRDPGGARETLDAMLAAAGDHASAELVLETARARMLVGDHAGAAALLATADKLPGIVAWKLARERGRLALRRGDLATAGKELTAALESCGTDTETFLLVADAATMETGSQLGEHLKQVMAQRLPNSPVAQIALGKLLLQAGGKDNEADAEYRAARDALRTLHAPARLIAQADYGLAVVAYNKSADATALDELNSVLNGDPSLYDAYLFKADLLGAPPREDTKAAFDLAEAAVKYNPDYPRAWSVLGKLAAKNGDKATLQAAIARLKILAPTSADLKDLQKLR